MEFNCSRMNFSPLYEDNNTQIINTLVCKINELVDAVNELQISANRMGFDKPNENAHPTAKTIDPEDIGYIKLDNDSLQKFLKAHPEYNNNGIIEIPQKELTDPYAEQRKWVGKLCRFWDEEHVPSFDIIGILTDVNDKEYRPFQVNHRDRWENCEPVKPDDDIIYKGGKDGN